VDHFTRFCEAIPIVRQDTETIARQFVTKIIAQFGVPKTLLTDRGGNFTSALIQQTVKLLKIHKLVKAYKIHSNDILRYSDTCNTLTTAIIILRSIIHINFICFSISFVY
jgi:transposase-like protein